MRSIRTPLLLACGGMLFFGIVGMVAGFLIRTEITFISVLAAIAYSFLQMGLSLAMSAGTILIAYYTFSIYGTDASYLYFTLPLKRKDIYKAGILTFIYSTLILGASTIASYIIYFIPQIYYSHIGDITGGIVESQPVDEISNFAAVLFLLFLLGLIILFVVSFIFSAVSANACAIYGCAKAKKHKLLGSIITYFIFNSIISTVATVCCAVVVLFIVSSSGSEFMETEESIFCFLNVIVYGSIAINLAGTFICDKIAKSTLETKLDFT